MCNQDPIRSSSPAAPYEAPATEMERLVASAMEEVLGGRRIGRDEDFFSQGGDSLCATQVLSRLGQALALELPVPLLFRLPTPRLIASRLEEMLTEGEIHKLAEAMKDLTPEERSQLLSGGQ